MRFNYLSILLLALSIGIGYSGNSQVTTTIDFDDDTKWTGPASGYGVREYTDGIFHAISNNAFLQTTASQDGFPGANGTYAWRLRDATDSYWTATVASGGVSDFNVNVRRWDNNPEAIYTLEYSIDEGANWVLVENINATTLNDQSDFVNFSGTINSAATNIAVRVSRVSGERVMIDDFQWTSYTGTSCDTESNITETACQSYDFYGTTLTSSGTYQHVIADANGPGCDETVNLTLTIVSGYTYYADTDNDGFGDPNSTTEACTVPVGYVDNADDCDDTDPAIGEASLPFYVDADGDGFGAGTAVLFCADPGAGYSANADDCDDNDNTIYPGATEIMDDGIDQDCDGQDASALGTQFGIYEFNGSSDCNTQDLAATVISANVTFSDYGSSNTNCTSGSGYFNRSGWNQAATLDDTQYNEFTITPADCYEITLTKIEFLHRNSGSGGTPTWTLRSSLDNYAADIATGQSNTSDQTATVLLPVDFENIGAVTFRFYITNMEGTGGATWRNDNVTVYGFENTISPSTFYADADGDGFGDMNESIQACSAPSGYVDNDGDCDDTDATINPNTIWYLDADNDGFGDDNSTVQTCEQPMGGNYILTGGDCDDNDNTVYPGATEICDGKDNDCDGSIDNGLQFTDYYVDADGDGYGTGAPQSLCADPGVGYATNDSDCDDTDANITTGTLYYEDQDNDGFGAGTGTEFCTDPGAGYVLNNDDCDDTDADINPNTIWYLDADNDGFGVDGTTVQACEAPSDNTYALVGGDCDDNDNTVYPGATEICDGKDNDCDGSVDNGLQFTEYFVDNDGDGFGAGDAIEFCEDPGNGYSLTGDDCDDNNATIYPGATEIPNDGIDQDCDGEDMSTVGLDENTVLSFSVSPNPSNGEVVIRLSSNFNESSVDVYALTGELVMSSSFNGASTKLDLSELNTGMYLIKISNTSGTSVQRVVKK